MSSDPELPVRSELPVRPELPVKDDLPTLVSISAVAYICGDILHELIGHGVTAWLSGARRMTLSTVALQTDISTRWISANGTLVNLAAAAIAWLILRNRSRFRPATHYFLVLFLASNLFTGTGYFFFSGVMDFGDWAAVIHGVSPYWLWRTALILVGAALYYGATLLVAYYFRAFLTDTASQTRLRRVALVPYLTQAAVAALAGLLNPAGWFYVIASGLSSSLGANAGLLAAPFIMRGWHRGAVAPIPAIRRNPAWIVAGVLAVVLFVAVLGPGLTWSR